MSRSLGAAIQLCWILVCFTLVQCQSPCPSLAPRHSPVELGFGEAGSLPGGFIGLIPAKPTEDQPQPDAPLEQGQPTPPKPKLQQEPKAQKEEEGQEHLMPAKEAQQSPSAVMPTETSSPTLIDDMATAPPSSLRHAMPSSTDVTSNTASDLNQEPAPGSHPTAHSFPSSSPSWDHHPSSQLSTTTPTASELPSSTSSTMALHRIQDASLSLAHTNTPSPTTLSLAPLSSNSATSTSTHAVIGVSVSFGLLSIAGLTGLYLFRRRRNQRFARSFQHDKLTHRPGSGRRLGFLRISSRDITPKKSVPAAWPADCEASSGANTARPRPSAEDPEWSIESASHVAIVHGGSPTAVRVPSRSGSRREGPLTSHPPRNEEGDDAEEEESEGVMRVGMMIEDTSPTRPPTWVFVSHSVRRVERLPPPPFALYSSGGGGRRGSVEGEGEVKMSNWPLGC